MKSRGLCVILGVLMIALLFPYSAAADWQIECLDCPRNFDWLSNRALAFFRESSYCLYRFKRCVLCLL